MISFFEQFNSDGVRRRADKFGEDALEALKGAQSTGNKLAEKRIMGSIFRADKDYDIAHLHDTNPDHLKKWKEAGLTKNKGVYYPKKVDIGAMIKYHKTLAPQKSSEKPDKRTLFVHDFKSVRSFPKSVRDQVVGFKG